MHDLSHATREALQLVAILSILLATAYKLLALYRNTRRWNGLGRALRNEKWTYIAVWLWLLVKQYVPALDNMIVFALLAVAVVVAEVRVSLFVPRVNIRHDRT